MNYSECEVGSQAWEFYTQDGKKDFPETMVFKRWTMGECLRKEVPVEKLDNGNYRWENVTL